MRLGKYETGNIYNADCTVAMKELPSECIDMVLTDPPYNIAFSSQHRKDKFEVIPNDDLPDEEFEKLLATYFAECYRILKPDTFLITFMRWSTVPFFERTIKAAGFTIKAMPIWVKNNFGLGYYMRPQYEPMYLAMKGNPKPPQNAISDVLHYPKVNSQDLQHSCQKPIGLLQVLLKTFMPAGKGVVFDGFMGSGSTAIAARKLRHEYIGFEIDPRICQMANQRIIDEFAQASMFWD